MSEVCPSYPGQEGEGEITQDGMSPAGSKKQANKGSGDSDDE